MVRLAGCITFKSTMHRRTKSNRARGFDVVRRSPMRVNLTPRRTRRESSLGDLTKVAQYFSAEAPSNSSARPARDDRNVRSSLTGRTRLLHHIPAPNAFGAGLLSFNPSGIGPIRALMLRPMAVAGLRRIGSAPSPNSQLLWLLKYFPE